MLPRVWRTNAHTNCERCTVRKSGRASGLDLGGGRWREDNNGDERVKRVGGTRTLVIGYLSTFILNMIY